MSSANVKNISECYIRPKFEVNNSEKPYYLTPTDLSLLSTHYIQNGLLFSKSSNDHHHDFSIHNLKNSLASTLVHFHPLAGQLVTQVDEINQSCLVYVDCNKGPGVRFVHASLDMTVEDIMSPVDIPMVVDSLFDHHVHGALNHDGHSKPLLSIQVTELLDGVFIGCTMNHSVADGASFWHFWNVWSALHMDANSVHVQLLPVCDGYREAISLPYTHPDQFIRRSESTGQHLRKRIFHFSSEFIAKIKAEANEECGTNDISSLQALSALLWRSIVRANIQTQAQGHEVTTFVLVANNRQRLNPPMPKYYFGNYINAIKSSATTGEVVAHNLGWTGSILQQSVVNHNDKVIRDYNEEWVRSPRISQLGAIFTANTIMVMQSPRFDMYGNEFGLGKPVAVRSGYASRFGGAVSAYPGYQGGGSIDLEICLPPDIMQALESYQEFTGS